MANANASPSSLAVLDGRPHPINEFLRAVAQMKTEEELEDAGDSLSMEDAFAAVNELIEQARELIAQYDHIVPATDADGLLEDLVQQLDGLGIPDWHGAEGLALDGARAYLAGPARVDASAAARHAQAAAGAATADQADWTLAEWREDVARGDTRRGYGEWVVDNRQQEFEQNLAMELHVVRIGTPDPARTAST